MMAIDQIPPQLPCDIIAENQEIVLTEQLEKAYTYLMALAGVGTDRANIGMMYGNHGLGKTTTIVHAVRKAKNREHIGFKEILYYEFPPMITPLLFCRRLVRIFKEKPKGTHFAEIIEDQLRPILHKNEVRLFVFDECDRANAETLDALRYLFARTGISILMLGTSQTYNQVTKIPALYDRVWNELRIVPPSEAETLSLILPGLKFSHWNYDKNSAQDKEMGSLIYKLTGGNLRRIDRLLKDANQRVALLTKIKIEKEDIEYFLPASPKPPKKIEFSPDLSPEDLSALRNGEI